MKISCEICGASATDELEIFKAMASNICPCCLTIGSLYIEKGGGSDGKVY